MFDPYRSNGAIRVLWRRRYFVLEIVSSEAIQNPSFFSFIHIADKAFGKSGIVEILSRTEVSYSTALD